MVRFQDHSKSSAVTGSPFVHCPSVRSLKVTVFPSCDTFQDSARFGTGSSFSSSFTSGSIVFMITSADVVSEARPGSSDGGSVPQLMVITWSITPPSPPDPSSPPHPTANAARVDTIATA